MVRCVEREFLESRNRVPSFLLQLLNGLCYGDDFCVVAREAVANLWKSLRETVEAKQSGHVGFSASDAKELKILNRKIKIDVLNDEMTLEADTRLVRDALETMKLVGARGVDSATCQEE